MTWGPLSRTPFVIHSNTYTYIHTYAHTNSQLATMFQQTPRWEVQCSAVQTEGDRLRACERVRYPHNSTTHVSSNHPLHPLISLIKLPSTHHDAYLRTRQRLSFTVYYLVRLSAASFVLPCWPENCKPGGGSFLIPKERIKGLWSVVVWFAFTGLPGKYGTQRARIKGVRG